MDFDVIVIGAGHAGVEAAWAASRLGCHVGLCRLPASPVAHMPCNPAVGGTAKGHLVREIDALGGLMGRASDATGIQFKLLNRSRGPAVWSPRAQADKRRYSEWVESTLAAEGNITTILGRAGRVLTAGGRVTGLAFEDGRQYSCGALVVTTGTFLNGLMHLGREQRPAGRAGEPPSKDLAESLKALGFATGRLKTGTPPRLDRKSIDFSTCVDNGTFAVETGDTRPVAFSFLTKRGLTNQVPCWLLHTNSAVHEIVKRHVDESPLFNGQIQGIGPRYCPSLEDKVMRFPDRERHQLYLEPEGVDVDEIYVNGFSMSLPQEIQESLVHALPGLERARLIRPGYAVEYDFIQPTELRSSLEAHRLPGLFCAGQINGTSGYEEAAAQGLMAGVNAARAVRREKPFRLERHEAYIGVLVDDLVTKGCVEPYRMFTSRAEHRLLLRIDNADLRLTPRGREVGLVDDERWERFRQRRERYDRNFQRVRQTLVKKPNGQTCHAIDALRDQRSSLAQMYQLGHIELEIDSSGLDLDVSSVEIEVKYEGYLKREIATVARSKREENRAIPSDFPFGRVPGLSKELAERFTEIKPETLGQASRLSGATPASIAVLAAFLGRLSGDGLTDR